MSAVCILAPVVIAGWPAFSSAVAAAAATLGYQVAADAIASKAVARPQAGAVHLEIPQSKLITDQIERDQRIRVTRDGVTVTFSRDARGKAALCVTGNGHSNEALRALGEQLCQRVVQQYVYQKLMEEMQARGFVVVEEQTQANQTIRLKVRHWEG